MSFIVKNTTHLAPLDLIAPHSCRGCGHIGCVLCNRCKNNITKLPNHVCPNCNKPTKNHYCTKCNLPPIFYVGPRTGLLDELIHEYKYNSTRSIKTVFANSLNRILPQIDGKVVIVPLPTISRHVRERGLDHTYRIAKALAKTRGKNYQVQKLLKRNKNFVQVGTDRKTRLLQAKDAYTLSNSIKIEKATTYILFDDVWTTGASMKAALKKLQQAGASKIIILLLAVS